MASSKKDVEKRLRIVKEELVALETKIKAGGATREDHEALTKLRKKFK
jgi:hypothetical protein